MIRYFTIVVFLCALQTGLSQTEAERETNQIVMNRALTEGLHEGIPYYAVNHPFKEEEADFYLDEFWKESIITTLDENQYPVLARYCMYNDEFELLDIDEVKWLDRKKIISIHMDDKIFVPCLFKPPQKRPAISYFQLLSEEPFILLKKYELKEKKKEWHPVYGYAGSDVTYEMRASYYLHQGDRYPEELSISKKRISNALSREVQEKAETYVRDQKLNLRNEEDLLQLFNFLNQSD